MKMDYSADVIFVGRRGTNIFPTFNMRDEDGYLENIYENLVSVLPESSERLEDRPWSTFAQLTGEMGGNIYTVMEAAKSSMTYRLAYQELLSCELPLTVWSQPYVEQGRHSR